jgi:C4-dicarboxylate-specific signal transduction histidine kinase
MKMISRKQIRSLFRTIETDEFTARAWQERFLDRLLFIGMILGVAAAIPSIWLSLKESLVLIALADIAVVIFAVALNIGRGWSYTFRALSVCAISYAIGMLLLVVLGPFGGGPIWLFAFPVLVGVLLSEKRALAALAANVVTLIVVGLLLVKGAMQWQIETINPIEKWIVISVNFVFLNAVATLSITSLLHGLKRALDHERALRVSLRNESDAVESARVLLEEEIRERILGEEEKKILEAKLYESHKLEAVGTLAAGVAHEINNPLMGMINYADLIEVDLEDGKLKEYAQGIMHEGNRIATITRGLLSFARQGQDSFQTTEVTDIIDGALSLAGSLLRKNQISLQTSIAEHMPSVVCQSQRIQQVLINLLTNARDALNERYPGYDENKIMRIIACPFSREAKTWVRITVEDLGNGISEETLKRVFDPFFSTKAVGSGTGLGLSVSYGIVRDHFGELRAKSVPGELTRMILELPTERSRD